MKYVGVKTTGELKLHEVKEPQTDEIYMAVEDTKLGAVPIRPYEFAKWDGQKWIKVDNVELATTLDIKNVEDEFAAIIPDDASKENKLVTENGDKMEVSAAAFNELNARLTAIESAITSGNIGSVIADSIDTQTLLVGGSDLEARVAAIEAVLTNNNLRTAAAPAASFTKSVSVDNLDLQVEDKTEVTETKKAIEDNIMEEK